MSSNIWVQTGYEIFAHTGLHGLKVETLAKKVGISKSSFYHHFADMAVFVAYLLDYHIQQCEIIGNKERQCLKISPDLIHILLDHKTDLLFNRQLRIHRDNSAFNATLTKAKALTGDAFVLVWVKDLNLTLKPQQLYALFELALENFFLQINEQNLNYDWLSDYFSNLKRIAKQF